MDSAFNPGALLARTFALPSGLRATLRLARARDRAGIEALLRRHGGGPYDESEAARLVNFDVAGQIVLCATALVDGRDRLIGFGTIDLSAPDTTWVVVDPVHGDGLAPLLHDALLGRAGQMRQVRRAA